MDNLPQDRMNNGALTLVTGPPPSRDRETTQTGELKKPVTLRHLYRIRSSPDFEVTVTTIETVSYPH